MIEGKFLDLESREGTEFVSEDLRLERDLLAIGQLIQGNHPKKILLRVCHSDTAWFIMGDSSKAWFGLGMYGRGKLWNE